MTKDEQIAQLQARLAEVEGALAIYREIFDEITLKAKPLCENDNEPDRVTAYRIPVGPIHRACGKVNHHMLGIADNIESAIEGLRKYEMSEECKQDIAAIEDNMRRAMREAPNFTLRAALSAPLEGE